LFMGIPKKEGTYFFKNHPRTGKTAYQAETWRTYGSSQKIRAIFPVGRLERHREDLINKKEKSVN